MSSDPHFLACDLTDPLPEVGTEVRLGGEEGRHAATVRRVRTGERVVLSDGRGRGVRGTVIGVDRDAIVVEVLDPLTSPPPVPRFVAAQALAKGDRAELAVEMLTEIGVAEIVPWQAARSIVRWSADRGVKGPARWRRTAREAAKQSRRLRVPTVSDVVSTRELAARVEAADCALVLHEAATVPLRSIRVPEQGTVLVIIGPEGGIAEEELAILVAAGGRAVLLGDGVLRTSTAGLAACAALMLR